MKRMKQDIDIILTDAIAGSQTPCAAVMLWKDGEEALFKMDGYADIGQNKPIARDSIYRLYSLSKPMTAVAATTLIERGKLDLVAPVYEYLEGFRNQRAFVNDTDVVPVKRPMQVRDLFSMTSGLPYPSENSPAERAVAALYAQFQQEQAENKPLSTVGAANRIGQCPLAFHPGEKWLYGTSADILGAVIEVVSGKPLNEYMTEALFAPLEMEDTDFFVAENKRDRLTTLYKHQDGALVKHPESDTRCGVFSQPGFLEGGAGVFSTIDDVMRFGRMLLGGGKLHKTHILSQRAVHWLSTNHLNDYQLSFLNWDSVLGYGYGGLMRVMLWPGQSFSLGAMGEFGWDGWTGTYMSVSPETNTVLVMMQQLADAGTNAVNRKLRNVVYANI